jgi:hypothetical protein
MAFTDTPLLHLNEGGDHRAQSARRNARKARDARARKALSARERWTPEDVEAEEELLASQIAEMVAAGRVTVLPAQTFSN